MKIQGFDDTIEWYNKNAKQYFESSERISFEEIIQQFLKKLPANPSVLDAGCGTGRDSRVLTENGANVTAIDISEGLIEIARAENPDIQFIKTSFLNLPLEDALFDGVWSHASLVHLETLEDVTKALSEFYRVLKPGGWLYVYVKKQTGEEKTAIVSDSLSNHERFFRYYTPEELTGLLSKTGFIVGRYETKQDPHGREEVEWLQFIVQKTLS